MGQKTRVVNQCGRCGHEWIGRSEEPRRCAKCKSPYWDREPVKFEPSTELEKAAVAVYRGEVLKKVKRDENGYCRHGMMGRCAKCEA